MTTRPRKILIDCDPGVDDAVAILLALAAPEEIEVLGLTCVRGNVALHRTHANARRVLALAGRSDIPVRAGMARALLHPVDITASSHGTDGLGDIGLPDAPPGIDPQHAVHFLIERAARHPGEITLCVLGPMTNIAMAMLLDSRFAANLHDIVFMGGAVWGPGNMNDYAEFNLLMDPHAARIFLQAGVPTVMFGLDVTRQAVIRPVHLDRLRATGSTCARTAANMMAAYARGDRLLHDPCVVAWLIDPGLFTGTQARIEVATDSGPQIGRTIAVADPTGPCLVMTQTRPDPLFDLLLARLARLP